MLYILRQLAAFQEQVLTIVLLAGLTVGGAVLARLHTVGTVIQSADKRRGESVEPEVSAGLHVESKGEHIATIQIATMLGDVQKTDEIRLDGINLREVTY